MSFFGKAPPVAHLGDVPTLDARNFAISIRKLADSLSYGTDKSAFVGAGVEYVQSRPYVFGDSVRAIDWRVTARTNKVHVKEYETPRSFPCLLLIDTSASMAVSSIARSKYHLALYLAGGIAFAALDRVSPVGVLGLGERVLRARPSLSRRRVLEWLLDLRRYRLDEATILGRRLAELAPSLGERSLFVVLSDLHDANALPALKGLAQKHDVVCLHLQDPAEVGLRGSGLFRAREAETGREFLTRGHRAWMDPEVVRDELRRAGVDHLLIRTDRPFEARLRHLFKARGAFARGAR